jgi:hypothetical protein
VVPADSKGRGPGVPDVLQVAPLDGLGEDDESEEPKDLGQAAEEKFLVELEGAGGARCFELGPEKRDGGTIGGEGRTEEDGEAAFFGAHHAGVVKEEGGHGDSEEHKALQGEAGPEDT